MEKYIAVFLFSLFLFPADFVGTRNINQGISIHEMTESQISGLTGKKDSATLVKGNRVNSEQQKDKQRKKLIEAKEHSVNKNKKVKFFGVDETLPQMIQKRNIP